MARNDKVAHSLLQVVGIVLLLFSLAVFIYLVSPYADIKTLLDRLPRDGSLEMFTPQFYQTSRVAFLLLGVVLLGLSALLLLYPARCSRVLHTIWAKIRHSLKALKVGRLDLWRDLHGYPISLKHGVLLGLVLLAGITLRLLMIDLPLHYDEAYTYSEFARHSVGHIMSDYHVPNNHMLNSLLMHLSIRCLGIGPLALRLPALLAGMLLIGAVYIYGRRIAGPEGGLLAAWITTLSGAMIYYASQARGYSLIQLCTVLLFILGDYARRHKNLFVWLLIVLVLAAGFYCTPLMVYPCGMWLVWMAAAALRRQQLTAYGTRRRWLTALIVICLLVFAIVYLLYLPLTADGNVLRLLSSIQDVDISTGMLLQSVPAHIGDVMREWREGFPLTISFVLLVGWTVSLFVRKKDDPPVSPQFAFLLFIIPALLVQKPIFITRMWSFLIPLAAVWVAQGLIFLLDHIQPLSLCKVLLIGFALLTGIFGGRTMLANYQDFHQEIIGDEAERVTQTIKEDFNDSDIFIISPQADAKYWYTFERYGLSQASIRDVKTRPFDRAFVIVYPEVGESAEMLLDEYGPGSYFIDPESAALLLENDHYRLFRFEADRQHIAEQYGVQTD